jgi:hypothetical protein
LCFEFKYIKMLCVSRNIVLEKIPIMALFGCRGKYLPQGK